jgi:hypothetical protein
MALIENSVGIGRKNQKKEEKRGRKKRKSLIKNLH